MDDYIRETILYIPRDKGFRILGGRITILAT